MDLERKSRDDLPHRWSVVHYDVDNGLIAERRKGDTAGVLGPAERFPSDRLVGHDLRDLGIPTNFSAINLHRPASSVSSAFHSFHEADPLRQALQVRPCLEDRLDRTPYIHALLQAQRPHRRYPAKTLYRQCTCRGGENSGDRSRQETRPKIVASHHCSFVVLWNWSKFPSRQVANLRPVDFRAADLIFIPPVSLCFSALINRKDIFSTGYPRNLFALLFHGFCSSAILLPHQPDTFNDRNASIVIEGRALREHVRT